MKTVNFLPAPCRKYHQTVLHRSANSVCGSARYITVPHKIIDAKAVNNLIALNARVAQNQAEYQERYDALVRRYEETDAKRTEMMGKIGRLAIRRRKIKRFIQSLEEQPDAVTEFDAGGWAALVSTMTVNSKSDITFQLTSGMEVRI